MVESEGESEVIVSQPPSPEVDVQESEVESETTEEVDWAKSWFRDADLSSRWESMVASTASPGSSDRQLEITISPNSSPPSDWCFPPASEPLPLPYARDAAWRFEQGMPHLPTFLLEGVGWL